FFFQAEAGIRSLEAMVTGVQTCALPNSILNSQFLILNSQFPTPDSRLPTPDSRLPTPDSRLPTPDSRLPTPCSLTQLITTN
ncbi:hypothetical protein, partial [Moorena sp. SIO3I6]|uniref:hypothetical protein n=1 Tax=Moorena sp. SIO3I6 TaxID=2607831 RepID=UPI0025D11412